MTILLGFPGQKFSRNEIYSEGRLHALLKTAPENSSKQCKSARLCKKLVGRLCSQASVLPAQALWLFCESAGFVIMMDGVFIEVVIVWYDMLVTIWCAVSFKYIVVIPNVLQV